MLSLGPSSVWAACRQSHVLWPMFSLRSLVMHIFRMGPALTDVLCFPCGTCRYPAKPVWKLSGDVFGSVHALKHFAEVPVLWRTHPDCKHFLARALVAANVNTAGLNRRGCCFESRTGFDGPQPLLRHGLMIQPDLSLVLKPGHTRVVLSYSPHPTLRWGSSPRTLQCVGFHLARRVNHTTVGSKFSPKCCSDVFTAPCGHPCYLSSVAFVGPVL